MLNKTILAIALTIAITSAAGAAPKQDRLMAGHNQTAAAQASADVLFERAKGGIDY